MASDPRRQPERSPLEERISNYARSELARSETERAADAPRVRAEELDALRRGELDDERSEALATQLVHGADWERHHEHLADDAPTWAARRVAALLVAAAAAVIVMLVVDFGDGKAHVGLDGARLVDPSGLELRGGLQATQARVLASAVANGSVALVVERADGTLQVVAVEPPNTWATVDAGEDVLLPLTGSVATHDAQRWVVLHAPSQRSDDATRDAARRALDRDTDTTDVDTVIVTVRDR